MFYVAQKIVRRKKSICLINFRELCSVPGPVLDSKAIAMGQT